MSSRSSPRIVIVGGGVNGIGSAVAILKAYPTCLLTVYAEKLTPHTTGNGAAGIWGPYELPDTPSDKIIKWSHATWDLFSSWWRDGDPGVFITTVEIIKKEHQELPPWNHIPFGCRYMNQNELRKYGEEYVSGVQYSAFVAEPSIFLPSLQNTLRSIGGKIRIRRITSLDELSEEADIIINCSGIGSYYIVPDHNVFPIRGQVTRVKAPWINTAVFDDSDDSFAYIIPNTYSVVLGGTHQHNDWRIEVDETDSEAIWSNCLKAMPSLKHAEVIKEWVGLRPARKGGLRLEEDEIDSKFGKIPVVHNYGHGGSGITLFWGCAKDVVKIVGNILHTRYSPLAYSKL